MSNRYFLTISCLTSMFLAACSPLQQVPAERGEANGEKSLTSETKPPNFIVLIGDDMSVETLSCFGVGDKAAVTPNLDRLCAQGMRFDNFWAQPVCSPTRATILSGRYGFRNGVGTPAESKLPPMPRPEMPANASLELRNGGPRPPAVESAPGLRSDEFTLPMALKSSADANYETALFGKWHLADPTNGGADHPNKVGFDHYHGSVRGGGVESFFSWSEVINGEITEGDSGWADSAKVDDAIEWLGAREADRPYLLWMAFNAPHTPFHKPPEHLLNSAAKSLDPQGITEENQHDYYYAMIEALDTEIGRLLDTLTDDERANTYVLFVGDNGTPEQVATSPFDYDRAKGSLTQGGVSVPFIMAGPEIKPGASAALANSVDIYATLTDLAGINLSDVLPKDKIFDTVSLKPVLRDGSKSVRDFAYADLFGTVPRGKVSEKTIRDTDYKYILFTDGDEALFKLSADPYEKTNLLTQKLSANDEKHLASLKGKLATIIGPE